jgi:glutaredoxin
MADQIRIYGADWCGDTRRALRVLESSGVQFDYINIDDDADGEKKVIEFNKGKRRIPLVEIASEKGTQSLSVPSETELKGALG